MKLEEIAARLQEPDSLEVLRPHWEDSVATLGEEGPSFLDPAEYTLSREYCGFGAEIDPLLAETASRIARDPALRLLAWHCFRLVFEHPEYEGMGRWPSLD